MDPRSESREPFVPDSTGCPHCGGPAHPPGMPCPQTTANDTLPVMIINQMARLSSHLLGTGVRNAEIFGPQSSLILQLLPSDIRLTLTVKSPVVLGREVQPISSDPEGQDLLDLTPYQAYQHGVSRRHCMLKRREDQLVIIDLGGANGTYINGLRLPAYQEYVVTHGSRLVLGTLHILVTFSDPASPLTS